MAKHRRQRRSIKACISLIRDLRASKTLNPAQYRKLTDIEGNLRRLQRRGGSMSRQIQTSVTDICRDFIDMFLA